MTVRFLRGGLPFVDELILQQTAAFLSVPFLKPGYAAWGTDGIVLHARYVYFALSLLTAGVVFSSLKRRLGAISAASALLVMAFIPLAIPTLNYNTWASFGLTIGLFSLFSGHSFMAGLACAIGCFAYPPLLLPTTMAGILALRRPKEVGLFLAGGIPIAMLAIQMASLSGFAIDNAIYYSLTSFGYGAGLEKLWIALKHLVSSNVAPLAWLSAVTLLLGLKHKAWIALFPVVLAAAYVRYPFSATWWLLYYSLWGGLLFFLERKDPDLRRLAKLVWLPSVVAGIVTAWTSASSAANAVIGLLPAAVVVTVAWTRALCRSWPPLGACPAAAIATIVAFLQFWGVCVYGDGEIRDLNARVTEGPFRGLYTSEAKLAFLREVETDIHRLEKPRGHILFMEFPAGYLISSMSPGAPSSWLRTISRGKHYYLDYYRRHPSPNNLVFKLRLDHFGHHYPRLDEKKDVWESYLRETHRPILDKEGYVVLAPRERANF